MCSKGFEVVDPVESVGSPRGGRISLLTPMQFQECYYPVQGRPTIGAAYKEIGIV